MVSTRDWRSTGHWQGGSANIGVYVLLLLERQLQFVDVPARRQVLSARTDSGSERGITAIVAGRSDEAISLACRRAKTGRWSATASRRRSSAPARGASSRWRTHRAAESSTKRCTCRSGGMRYRSCRFGPLQSERPHTTSRYPNRRYIHHWRPRRRRKSKKSSKATAIEHNQAFGRHSIM